MEDSIKRYKLHKVKTKWVTIGTTLCGSVLAMSAINGSANADTISDTTSKLNSESVNKSNSNDEASISSSKVNDNDVKSLANSNKEDAINSTKVNESNNLAENDSNKANENNNLAKNDVTSDLAKDNSSNNSVKDNSIKSNSTDNLAGDIKAENADVKNGVTDVTDISSSNLNAKPSSANNINQDVSAEDNTQSTNIKDNTQSTNVDNSIKSANVNNSISSSSSIQSNSLNSTKNDSLRNVIPELNYSPAIPSYSFVATPQPRDAQSEITYGSCNDLNQLDITLKDPLQGDIQSQVQFSNGGGIKSVTQNGNHLSIITNNDIDFRKAMTVTVNGQSYTIDPTDGTQMPVVRSNAFCNKYIYNGNDLGVTYTKDATTFKIWAPTASAISLNLFDNDTDPNAKLKSWTPMTFDPNTGVWSVTIKGDLKDTAYDYNEEFANGKAYELYDPYATACVKGGFRSVVLSPDEVGGNVTAGKVVDKDDPTDEVIGEIHVRDFTNDPSSGVDSNIRGTYLGVVQEGTKNSKGQATGLDYLKQQGINTVQIQPMYQYDDDGANTNSSYEYDWGYDPENYNIPEGWYSTNRDDPATRIKECKEMVQKLHDNGIRVNMDVVYNHVADHGTNALAKSVPGYYFRYGNDGKLTNASACGNDIASERPMVRNYILHSVKYWHDVYGIDGFRFDLMGNLDVDTMNAIRKELPDVVLYGEGWNMGANIPDSDKADQANENKMPTVGSFNGWGRDVIRGSDDGNSKGYITGNQSQQTMSSLGNFIYGCQNQSNTPSDAVDSGVNYVNPGQVINYTECHDNKTLFDVMKAAYPDEADNVLMRRAELGNAINILNEGVPFLQVGQGFGRTKQGDGNSYRSGDKINNINWDLEAKYPWAVSYEKALLQLRSSDPAFRMTSFNDMNNNMKWVEIGSNNGVIGYELTSPSTGKKYIIAYSNNAGQQQLTGIPNGNWNVLIKDCNGYLDNPQKVNISNGSTDIPSLSCLVLEQDPQQKSTINVTYQDANGNKVGNYSNNQDGTISDAEKEAEQHIPSGYHFVKTISSKNNQSVKDGINYNDYELVIEVAKNQQNTSSNNTNSKPTTSTNTNSGNTSNSNTTKPSDSGSSNTNSNVSTNKPTTNTNTSSSTTTKPNNSSSSSNTNNVGSANKPTTNTSSSNTSSKPSTSTNTNNSNTTKPSDSSSSNTNSNIDTNKPTANTSSSNTNNSKPSTSTNTNSGSANSSTTTKPSDSSSSNTNSNVDTNKPTTNTSSNSTNNSKPTTSTNTNSNSANSSATTKPSGNGSSSNTNSNVDTNKPTTSTNTNSGSANNSNTTKPSDSSSSNTNNSTNKPTTSTSSNSTNDSKPTTNTSSSATTKLNDNGSSNNTSSSNSDETKLPAASELQDLKSIYDLQLSSDDFSNHTKYPAKVVDYQGKLYVVDKNNGVYQLSNNDKYDINDGYLFSDGKMLSKDGDICSVPYTTDDFGKVKPTTDHEIYLGFGDDYKVIGNHIVPNKNGIEVIARPNNHAEVTTWIAKDPSGNLCENGKGEITAKLLDGSLVAAPSEDITYSIAPNGDITLTYKNEKSATLQHNLLGNTIQNSSSSTSKPSNNNSSNDVGSVVDKPSNVTTNNSNDKGSSNTNTSSSNNSNKTDNNSSKNNSSNEVNSSNNSSNNGNVNNSANTNANTENKPNNVTNGNNNDETNKDNSSKVSNIDEANKDNSSKVSTNDEANKDNSSKVSTSDKANKDNSSKTNSQNGIAGDVDAKKLSAANKDEINNAKENQAGSSEKLNSKDNSSKIDGTTNSGININSTDNQGQSSLANSYQSKGITNSSQSEDALSNDQDQSSSTNSTQLQSIKSQNNNATQVGSSSNKLPQTGDSKDEIILGALLSLGLIGMIKVKKND